MDKILWYFTHFVGFSTLDGKGGGIPAYQESTAGLEQLILRELGDQRERYMAGEERQKKERGRERAARRQCGSASKTYFAR